LPARPTARVPTGGRKGARRHADMQPQPHIFVAQTEEQPCRDQPLDQARATGAPAGLLARGSQLDARLPRPTGPVAALVKGRVHRAIRLQLQGQPRIWEQAPAPHSRLSSLGSTGTIMFGRRITLPPCPGPYWVIARGQIIFRGYRARAGRTLQAWRQHRPGCPSACSPNDVRPYSGRFRAMRGSSYATWVHRAAAGRRAAPLGRSWHFVHRHSRHLPPVEPQNGRMALRDVAMTLLQGDKSASRADRAQNSTIDSDSR
jgi:hypothetical protein